MKLSICFRLLAVFVSLGHAAGVYTDEEVRDDLERKLQRAIFLLVALLSHLAGSSSCSSFVSRHSKDVSHVSSLRGAGVDDEPLQSERELNFWGAIGDWFTGCPAGNEGDNCSAGCTCSGSNTCEAWSHVCRAPGKLKDACHATRPCGSGFNCQPGVQQCYNVPRLEGQPCVAGYGCKSGLHCEAGTHVCRAPGKLEDACHATRPCGSGLNCQPGVQQCYNVPRLEGQPCVAGYGCKSGLHCEAGTHVCRAPGKLEDACHATRPCGSGLNCQPGVQQCYNVPRLEGQPCVAGYGCESGLHCEAGTHVCRKAGTHGDTCHLTRPCASGYWCVDAISAYNYQQCVPDCTSFDPALVAKIESTGYSGSGVFDEKWQGGVVPFQADCGLENNELALFSTAMKHIEEKTSVRFERYDSSKHDNWVILADVIDGVASSRVGRMKDKGWQTVNLDTDWGAFGDYGLGSAIHELVHALGWLHTQARPDRLEYVTINNINIEDGKGRQFDAQQSSVYDAVQKCRGYDYGSIMHYNKKAFSKNGENTITTLDSSKQDVIGYRDGLSTQDATEIEEYYFGSPKCLCWGSGTTCDSLTTCKNRCCSGAYCPWFYFGVCECN
jgi:hypothetical protein